MPKINQEEYEILKELIGESVKWICRDEDGDLFVYEIKPNKGNVVWLYRDGSSEIRKISNSDLFRFIQWEDENPHNIVELIEEYKRYEIGNIHVERKHPMFNCNRLNGFYNANLAIWDRLEESEETEVKKDIEWLKEEILGLRKNGNTESNQTEAEKEMGRLQKWAWDNCADRVYELINQLDEPEVLSQEWIDRHTYYEDEYDFYYADPDELKNLLVPKQELPVIPKFVADYIDDRKEVGFPIYQAIRIVRENSRFEHSHLREWLWTNKGQETFVRAWLDGYTVEEEQKYIVSDNSSVPLLIKNDDGKVMSYDSQIAYNNSNGTIELTEQEIKDYDPRYWAFAKPVEEVK